MNYEGALYRPPSESQSLLLQVTVGCSYNQCTFCDMYTGVEFKVKPLDLVLADVKEATSYRFKRVFLCDGDALIAPQDNLEAVLTALRTQMPFVERVGVYGDCRSILRKKPAELERLGELGLGIIYHGIESGDEQTLKAIKKGATVRQTIEAGRKVKDAGIIYSAIVMLGIAGRERSIEHARATAEVLNEMQPDFTGILTTMVVEGSPLDEQAADGAFVLPSRLGLLEELKTIIENLELKRGLVTANHASNYLNVRVTFPYQKADAVRYLDRVIKNADETVLKPEFLRGL